MKKYLICLIIVLALCYVGLSITGSSWNPVEWAEKAKDVAIPLLMLSPWITLFLRMFADEIW